MDDGRTTYSTRYGKGTLVWSRGLLVAHILPGRGGHAGLSGGSRSGTGVLGPESPPGVLARLLESYFNGVVTGFDLDSLPLGLGDLTRFERSVAMALAGTRYGELLTYADLAERAGFPGATRAVGNFMAKNPYPVIVPCHRVVRSDGRLGGFSAGALWKRRLIELESATKASRSR